MTELETREMAEPQDHGAPGSIQEPYAAEQDEAPEQETAPQPEQTPVHAYRKPPMPHRGPAPKERQRMLRTLLGGLGGAAVGAMLLTIGFWKTLFIAVFAGLGAVAFGVEDKQEWLRDIINRLIPPRS